MPRSRDRGCNKLGFVTTQMNHRVDTLFSRYMSRVTVTRYDSCFEAYSAAKRTYEVATYWRPIDVDPNMHRQHGHALRAIRYDDSDQRKLLMFHTELPEVLIRLIAEFTVPSVKLCLGAEHMWTKIPDAQNMITLSDREIIPILALRSHVLLSPPGKFWGEFVFFNEAIMFRLTTHRMSFGKFNHHCANNKACFQLNTRCRTKCGYARHGSKPQRAERQCGIC